jgi:hypothetical protein
MTRESSAFRVDALPDPFVVPTDVAAASPLHRRLVLSAGTSSDALAVDDRVGPLLDALRRPWDRFQITADVGLAGMVSARGFLTAIRGLADDLLLPSVAGRRGLAVGAHELLQGLYPDAVGSADALPMPRVPPALPLAQPGSGGLLCDRVVIVVGVGRSGTTWLEQLLLAHPRIGGVPHWESWMFHQLRWLWDANSALPAPVAPALRRYCDAIFTSTLAQHAPGADHIIEKSPIHSYHLGQIAIVYPDAWVVHLVRDGRDVARSISRVPFFNVPDVGDAAALWARTERAVRGARARVPRYREVRYESLYADPLGTVQSLCEWIGLPFDAEVIRSVQATAGERVSTHAGTAEAVGPGGWRSLPATDVDRIYRAAGPMLVETGYAGRLEVLRRRLRARLR